MTIRLLLVSILSLSACGGGSKKPPEEPTPPAAPTEPDTVAKAAPEEPETPPAAPVPPPPPPPPPKFALTGEAKIMMKLPGKKETATGDIVLAADGAITASMTVMAGKKVKKKETKTGKLTADGELRDEKDEVIAKLEDDATVAVRQVFIEKKDGKVVKSETKMEPVGTLSADGVFTNKKDGKTFSIDDKGKIAGIPGDFTVTAAAPEQKKAAMFVIVAMFAASTMTTDMSNASSRAVVAPVPPMKK